MSIDLKSFCADPITDPRYAICDPFVLGEFEYATDARIMVRMPSALPDTVRENLPPAKVIIGMFVPGLGVPISEELPWPLPRVKSRVAPCSCAQAMACADCEQVMPPGRIHMAVESLESDDWQCKEQICWECQGALQTTRYRPVQLVPELNFWVNGQLVEKINALPALSYGVYLHADGQAMSARFTFEGGSGVVMCMTGVNAAWLKEEGFA